MIWTSDPSVEARLERPFQTSVRLRARRYADWLLTLWSADAAGPGQVLAITHAEVNATLSEPAQQAQARAEFYDAGRFRTLEDALDQVDAEAESDPRWYGLQRAFQLTQPEIDLLALLLAAHEDPALARVYGYLHDDVQACYATPWLASRLFERQTEGSIGPDSALARWRLAWPSEAAASPWALVTPWVLDPFIAGWLMGLEIPDPALGTAVRIIHAGELRGLAGLYPEQHADICALVRTLWSDGETGDPQIEVHLIGAGGTGRQTLAGQVSSSLGLSLVVADAGSLLGAHVPAATALDRGLRVVRLARLLGAAVHWRNVDSVPPAIWPALPGVSLSLFAAATACDAAVPGAVRRVVYLPALKRVDRLRLWQRLTSTPAPSPITDWKLTPAEIALAAQSAPAGEAAVLESCRSLIHQTPGDLVTPLPCPFTWDDIVLTPAVRQHLAELEAQARLRPQVLEEWGFEKLFPLGRGLTALFAGPSGTGKTMAAQVIARALGIELHRIDLAGVVNKYIGETEKRLKQVFDACERANVLLFFDEADALFGQRMQVKDAHDRFANIEIDYLLQRMEQFDGFAILATNRKSDIDKAFLRRLRFVVDFVQPGPEERKRLWRLSLLPRSPSGHELLEAIDWEYLAEKLPFSGADIKSAALGAAFLARSAGTPIGMQHVLAASRRELTKHGYVLRPGEWEV